jgi:hypothetical protein
MAIEDEHAVETFKSLIQISLEGLKLLALFNGGAAVAVLAYMQTVAGKGLPVPDLRDSMTCYLFGLVTCGLAFLAGYVTQFFLYNVRQALQGPAPPYLSLLCLLLALASLAAFALGSYRGAQSLWASQASGPEGQIRDTGPI